jgi:hypothetical protein
MAKTPTPPSKVQQAVATNKAAQQARTTRVAETAATLAANAAKAQAATDAAKKKAAADAKAKADAAKKPPIIPVKTETGNYEYTDDAGNTYKITTYSDGTSVKSLISSGVSAKPEDYTSQREALKASLTSKGLNQTFINEVDNLALSLLSEYQGDAEAVANVILFNNEITVNGVKQQSPFAKYYGKYNDALTKANRAILSPAEIVNNVIQYEKILKNVPGLPATFYSDEKIIQYFVNDISPTELTKRVNDAQARIAAADPQYKATIKAYYGMDDTEILGFVLDPTIGEAELAKRQTATALGASAARSNVSVSRQRAEELASLGITETAANVGFGQVSKNLEASQKLASIYNENVTGLQTELEQEQFLGLASQKRKKLMEQEQASFAGKAGVAGVSLAQKTAGTF